LAKEINWLKGLTGEGDGRAKGRELTGEGDGMVKVIDWLLLARPVLPMLVLVSLQHPGCCQELASSHFNMPGFQVS
jgi:hypothetical protein